MNLCPEQLDWAAVEAAVAASTDPLTKHRWSVASAWRLYHDNQVTYHATRYQVTYHTNQVTGGSRANSVREGREALGGENAVLSLSICNFSENAEKRKTYF